MTTSTEFAIRTRGLVKVYGDTRALDGFDLAVRPGTVCGLLGPNGAGKSTAVRILCSLLRPTAGHAEVAGFDVVRRPWEVRYRIGLTGQNAAVDDVLTGRGNLEMFGKLYHLSAKQARRRADELLEQFGLADAANKQPKKYSGGMRRRLDLAISFIMAPPVLFLDEPTTGMDPRHRMEVWRAVRQLVSQGTTVLLTTHYLDEADQLADSISVVDHGTVIAAGTPVELKSEIGSDQLDVVLANPGDIARATAVLTAITGAAASAHEDVPRVSVPAADRVGTLTEVIRIFDAEEIVVSDIGIRKSTLDEVFVRLTGRPAESAEPLEELA
ncbi:daunorubicin/doxorubicin resistance ABC transporter ATP-binding protein DrrA [Actinosynnema sp. ALI-1.44]|uniref:ATP-binding cassette domain-containing protein n=1 Tax=Actinosynnema sp. ALI-1.44 TaxID=1933779 RepID=UPI00097C60F6|nr:ATP-binding cassette domain-containing protein [Actinosynnema sp. ALI-1.44]ONI87936.1 daunorubicin/doxorubicin resistance ABC transporter ATP-binding protein DrrA [Actinosynnema sp. ALI-1.44]